MTFLSRLSFLGGAKETTNGTPATPTFSVPFTKAQYETIYAALRDESVRANDAVLQGLYQGPADSTFDIETNLYPDIAGHFFRMIGPDTTTAGVSTTLSSDTIVGATSISVAATITAGSTIQIDTGANAEYAITGTPSGAGPYTIPLTTPVGGLTKPHTSSMAVVSQTTHTFAQSTSQRPPSYTWSVFDNVDYRTFAGSVCTELALKIDPKGIVTLNPKYIGFPEATAASFIPTFSQAQPALGWEWTVTNAGASSTRGLTMDITLKRAGEAIHTSNGVQAPRETFVGALEIDGSYKAIYEDTKDLQLYLNYTQTPTVHTLTKPLSTGGESVQITMSQSGYHKMTRDLSQVYVQASFDVSGIFNATDSGITQVVLKNFVSTAY